MAVKKEKEKDIFNIFNPQYKLPSRPCPPGPFKSYNFINTNLEKATGKTDNTFPTTYSNAKKIGWLEVTIPGASNSLNNKANVEATLKSGYVFPVAYDSVIGTAGHVFGRLG